MIGGVKLAEFHRRDAQRVLDAIIARGAPQSATKAFVFLRAICRWAVSRGDLDHSPPEGMKSPAPSKPSTRVLDDNEIRTLWHEWRSVLGKQCDLVLKLCLVTGQRSGEVSGMTTDEIDLKKARLDYPRQPLKEQARAQGAAH